MAGFVNNHPKGFKMSYACTIKFSHTNPYSHDAQSITILHLGGNQKNHGKKTKHSNTTKQAHVHVKTKWKQQRNKKRQRNRQTTEKKQANNRKETIRKQTRHTMTSKMNKSRQSALYICVLFLFCVFSVFLVVLLFLCGDSVAPHL